MLNAIIENLLAGFIGTFLGFLAKLGFDKYRKDRRNKPVIDFFNLQNRKIAVIHSAIFDKERGVYNYPASDTRAIRIITNSLESADLKEGKDFIVSPDVNFLNPDGTVNPKVMDYDLILMCAPKRNKITEEILSRCPKLRYRMTFDTETNRNLLYDTSTNNYFVASRDLPNNSDKNNGYDFGLIMSTPNPSNLNRNVIILAGIHGAGTIGTALAVSDTNKLKELCSKKVGGIMQSVVRAEFQGDYDNVTEVSIL
jgi:hypothetical protein